MKRRTIAGTVIVLVVAAAAVLLMWRITRPTDQLSTSDPAISISARDLDTPWSIISLPNDRLLVSERSGSLVLLGADQQRIPVGDVIEQGEGGLLGATLHPDFAANRWLYIYKTTGQTNIIERYRLADDSITDRQLVVGDIPAATVHNGGEIKFGPDNKLYITTGDASNDSQAQNTTSLAGKILRVNDDGTTPNDNPFRNAVWSYGHRNPQGLAWDDKQQLWSTEHGPSGSETGHDELNLIKRGANYGWPVIRGDEARQGMVSPVIESGDDTTWAPGGLVFANDSLYFTGLRGQTLYKAVIDNNNNVRLSEHLREQYGRLRSITVTGEALLIGTSNRDGRGTPADGDDKLLRVPFTQL